MARDALVNKRATHMWCQLMRLVTGGLNLTGVHSMRQCKDFVPVVSYSAASQHQSGPKIFTNRRVCEWLQLTELRCAERPKWRGGTNMACVWNAYEALRMHRVEQNVCDYAQCKVVVMYEYSCPVHEVSAADAVGLECTGALGESSFNARFPRKTYAKRAQFPLKSCAKRAKLRSLRSRLANFPSLSGATAAGPLKG
eukprot:1158662-Pleurochrysis_carterae.AAC.1